MNERMSLPKLNDNESPVDRLPLLIISGFLGAGKTTVLKSLLRRSSHLADCQSRGALLLLVNDFASENVDSALLSDSGNTVVSFSNGCVCCNLLGDLLKSLEAFSGTPSKQRAEYAILECTGLADAAPVVAAILVHPILSKTIRLDATVAVIDASQYDLEKDVMHGAQLMGSNAIILNKMDVAERRFCSHGVSDGHDEGYASFKSAILAFAQENGNKDVRLWPCQHGTGIPFDDILVNQFLFERHHSRRYYLPRAEKLLRNIEAEEALERERLGVASFTYRLYGDAPIRIEEVLSGVARLLKPQRGTNANGNHHGEWVQVWRSKGFFFAVEGTERKQFSWSSCGKRFDYCQVTEPAVALPLSKVTSDVVADGICLAEIVVIGRWTDETTARHRVELIFSAPSLANDDTARR